MEDLLVVALGPDQKGQMTLEAAEIIRSADLVLLRTRQHGAAQWIEETKIHYDSFDELHDQADDFDAFSAAVSEAIQTKMRQGGRVCYAVAEPQTDETVHALLKAGVKMRVFAGVTHASAAQAKALEARLPSGGACVIPAVDVQNSCINPDVPLIITEVSSRLLAGDIKIALLLVYTPDTRVLYRGEPIPLSALDRQPLYDHLSTVFIPACPYEKRERFVMSDLERIMARLRDPIGGCPWDLKQTHLSLREFLLEEAYEVIEAIDADDPYRVADELGDVLLQVVFHAQIAKEHGAFSLADVITAICAKMIHRHTHIFSDAHCDTSDDVLKNWEAIKKKEKNISSAADSMGDIPGRMPSLQRAGKVLEKAKRAGYRQRVPSLLSRAQEGIARIESGVAPDRGIEDAIGAILFDLVALAKSYGIESELALKKSVDQFIESFRKLEQWAEASGKQIDALTDEERSPYLK